MKKIVGLVTVVVLALALAATSALGAGLYSQTDLMMLPTPDAIRSGDMALALNFMEDDFTQMNFDFGLLTDLEVGIAAYNFDHETDFSVRAKYQLLHEAKSQPSLAVGIQDIGEDDLSPYLVLGKTFAEPGIEGYLGAGGGYFDGLFAGISKTFKIGSARNNNQLQAVQVFAEAVSGDFNLGAKLRLKAPVVVNFGFYDMDRWVLGGTIDLH